MLQMLRKSLIRSKFVNGLLKKDLEFHTTKTCYSTQTTLKEEDAEEVKIPVPWGHIAGKYWGPKDKTTFLTVHGWQDNAGSFDTLIPLISNEYSYLAIDSAGHGFSSHNPSGTAYSSYDSIATYLRIQKYFAWPKLNLLGHSLGSMNCFLFSTIFPDLVESYIGLDAFKPYSMDVKVALAEAKDKIRRLVRYDTFTAENANWYAEEKLIQMMNEAMNTKRDDLSRLMMKRGAVERKDGKFRPIRDPRVKLENAFGLTQKQIAQFAERIKCNFLIIKASDSGYSEPKENFDQIFEIVKKNAKWAEFHIVSGTHHVHLEKPEIVAPIINKFLADIK